MTSRTPMDAAFLETRDRGTEGRSTRVRSAEVRITEAEVAYLQEIVDSYSQAAATRRSLTRQTNRVAAKLFLNRAMAAIHATAERPC